MFSDDNDAWFLQQPQTRNHPYILWVNSGYSYCATPLNNNRKQTIGRIMLSEYYQSSTITCCVIEVIHHFQNDKIARQRI
jgi:hypothetical protein